MAEVFAGFVVGFALSIAVAPLGAILLVRSNDRTGIAQRIAPEGTSIAALSMVVHFAAFLVLTMLGLVLGIMLAGIEARRPAGGIGSPNVVYTLLILALTAVIAIPPMAVPGLRRYACVGAITFAIAFGWAMPWLASLA